MTNIQLSPNFWLEEFLTSETAVRYEVDMTPPPGVIENLSRLCASVLQPVRDYYNRPVLITSGYRPRSLNRLVRGSKYSDHVFGLAADFKINGFTPYSIVEDIQRLELPYKQLIHEFRSWVHVSIPPFGNTPRRQTLTALHNDDGQTVYHEGLLA